MKLAIVIPTFNEGRAIAVVIQGLRDLDLPGVEKEIIVVDDGSHDATAAIARAEGATVVRHVINRGLGATLGTGIAAALRRGAEIIVTCDADGQHAPEDIPGVIRPLQMGEADAVIGSRMLGRNEPLSRRDDDGAGGPSPRRGTSEGGMPFARRIANRMANVLTWVLLGVRTTDSQSGLRAFSRDAAARIRITANTYEVSSEICGEIHRRGFRLAEVPIHPIYTAYSLSKGQNFLMGLKTLFRMLLHLLERY